MQSLPRQEPVGLLLGAAVRRIRQTVTARARAFGLASRQFWVLVAVLEAEGLAMRELAARLRIDEPTASRTVAALARRRLVRVEPDAEDRRRTRIRATAAGEALRRPLRDLAAAIRGAVTSRLTPSQERALREGLLRVVEGLDRLDGEGSASSRARAVPRRSRP